jgi:hypothetical protein
VHLFFDESGDYAFGEAFDCYAQAALICPDECLSGIEAFVEDRCARWAMKELHATEMTDAQIVEVCEFIGTSDLQLLANVTDTVLITGADIERYRLDQAATLKRNLDWYKAKGGASEEIEQWLLRAIKRAGLDAQIRHGEFIQATFMLELIPAALQKSLIFYLGDRWRADSWDFRFVLDAKLPNKMAAGEKFLSQSILPTLGSRPKTRPMAVVDIWKEPPVHPFVEKYSAEHGRVRGEDVEGVFELNEIFKSGLEFVDSKRAAGLQLADAVAYTVRRAVLDPDNDDIQRAYDHLRPKLRTEDARSLMISTLSGRQPSKDSLEIYRPLYGVQRAY